MALLGLVGGAAPRASSPGGLVRLTDRAWAWVATDEQSSNGALLVGDKEALLVDPGLTPDLTREFLQAARQVARVPLRWVVLTHWHPDHSMGAVCSDDLPGTLLAHPRTRRSLAASAAAQAARLAAAAASPEARAELQNCHIRLPLPLSGDSQVVDLGGHRVEIFHPGAAHTQGDLVVWSAAERVLVTGDLLLDRSCPSMGEGSVVVWLEALSRLIHLDPVHVVPGHFAPGGVASLRRFRAYLQAQMDTVKTLLAAHQDLNQAALGPLARRFAEFSQYPQYGATFLGNARAVARELEFRPAAPGEAGGFHLEKVLHVGRAPHQIAFSADGRQAYVAAAGSHAITRIDAVRLEVQETLPVAGVPLGVAVLPRDLGLAVSSFDSDHVSWLPAAGKVSLLDSLVTGEGPSLMVGPLPGDKYLVSVEKTNQLWLMGTQPFALEAGFDTGRRPFPPVVTADGRKAFVPNYDDGTVTVLDLWNRKVEATVVVGRHPSGGAPWPGDREVVLALRGENRLVFINTASNQVVDDLQAGIGEGPFSVRLTPDGLLAFVNNTGSHDISVLSTATRRVIARIPVGQIPIVMAVHPSGRSLWVSSEGSHELDVISLPRELKDPAAPRLLADAELPITDVAVMGMIHGQHRSSKRWGLDQVRETIRRFSPDVICAEIPPDRWERIWKDWSERGVIKDPRVKRFPEYTDVLLPLKIQMGFQVEPCAGWTQEMSDLRQARLRQFENDPVMAPRYLEYQRRMKSLKDRQAAHPLVEDDPGVIHSVLYDERTREELDLYDNFLNDWIGPGGWSHINQAHYRLIDRAIRRHRGQRILITFGAGHKYWLLDRLRRRRDIHLLDLGPFLPGRGP